MTWGVKGERGGVDEDNSVPTGSVKKFLHGQFLSLSLPPPPGEKTSASFSASSLSREGKGGRVTLEECRDQGFQGEGEGDMGDWRFLAWGWFDPEIPTFVLEDVTWFVVRDCWTCSQGQFLGFFWLTMN